MSLNPEFRRNLWLEITASRLLGFAVLCGLLIALLEAGGSLFDFSDGYVMTGKVGFFLAAVVWGTRRAAAGLASELRGATWDWQRLSSMGAWQMTWGKLFGATSFAWLAGFVFLAFILAGRLGGVEGHRLWGGGPFAAPLELLSFLLDALLAQAVALATALVLLRKRYDRRSLPVTFCQAAGLIAYLLLSGADGTFFFEHDAVEILYGQQPAVFWYETRFAAGPFIIASKAFFLLAALISCHRLLREELQLSTRPWGWTSFLLLLAAYLNGFLVTACPGCAEALGLQAGLFAMVLGAGAYLALFADRKETREIASFLGALGRGSAGAALQKAPLWVPVLLLTAVFALASAFLGIEARWMDPELVDFLGRRAEEHLRPIILASFALLLRDAGLILGLAFARGARPRGDFVALFWLFLLHLLIPLVLRTMGLHGLAAAFTPSLALEPWQAFLGAGLQAAAGLGWAVWRYRAAERAFAASLPNAARAP